MHYFGEWTSISVVKSLLQLCHQSFPINANFSADKAHKKIHAHTTASATKKTEVGSTSAVDSHGPELASSRNELNTAESISSKSEFEYNTELLNKKPLAAINSQMPILAPSPPMKINYQNGVRINKGSFNRFFASMMSADRRFLICIVIHH